MKSSDVRSAFLEFFREREHEIVRSSSLIPRNDPTLLFTNAGMVQFKAVFLGQETRGTTKAVSCQKSMRAGGKHSDLENVGHTARHHTFFEMLGNFSFGDYFKREAIRFAWDLLTEKYGLPEERLWTTVYEDDDEAAGLWREVVGLPEERVVRLGAKDNFWQMADTGPCGPCSEILIDQGAALACGPECAVGCDCDRFLELWNLVFMQFNRDEHGELNPLPKPSIDTGMGLERLCAVLQGKHNNFDSDLFSEIIDSISSLTGMPYGRAPETDASIRVIADHVRALGFLVSDGLMPSNEGRGYVLKRILRRASRHARILGTEEPVLNRVLDAVVSSMGGVYPELVDEHERAQKVLRLEEERFARTLEQGMRILDDVLKDVLASEEKLIPGEEIFRLYDTFGFPVDLVRDIAHDSGFRVDEEGFHRAMEAQRERARASWVGEDAEVASIYREVLAEGGESEFLGYENLESESVVKAIIRDGTIVEEISVEEEAEVILDRTPFYGESGGQVGDTGTMSSGDVHLLVLDTKKPLEGLHSHRVRVARGPLRVWDRLHCRVDSERRKAIMRNHTATHLLQAALRLVLGEHVKQAGSLVAPDRFRFDFTHFSAVTREELSAVEEQVNERVMENSTVGVQVQDIEDALESGAVALFGEKYSEQVRIIDIPNFSRELCGGTHVGATGDIGPFVIESESSVASGIRRIEGATGRAAYRRIKDEERELDEIGDLLKAPEKPLEKVKQLLQEVRQLQREHERLKGAAMKDASGDIIASARDIDGMKVISHRLDGLSSKDLRALADRVRDKLDSGVIVLASVKDAQASLVSMVTADLTGRVKAGDIIGEVARASGGRGGGKPDMAQGGTRDMEKLDSALESVYDIIREKAGT
jgi:alanyl-tRNA synthetase